MMKTYFISAIASVVLFSTVACSNAPNKAVTEDQQTNSDNRSSDEDVLLVYQIKYKQEGDLKKAGEMKLYLSGDAVRSEMDMQLFGQAMKMTMLGNADDPNKTIMLNPENKTDRKSTRLHSSH